MPAGSRYTPQEINDILEACARHGVGRLQVGNFKVSFLSHRPKAPEPATPPTPEQSEALEVAESESREEWEKRVKEDYLAMLRLSDPVEYEELINRGELIDAGQESAGTDA